MYVPENESFVNVSGPAPVDLSHAVAYGQLSQVSLELSQASLELAGQQGLARADTRAAGTRHSAERTIHVSGWP